MSRYMILFFGIFVSLLCGCSEHRAAKEIAQLAGYIIIENNLLYIDEVEIVTDADTERIADLGLERGDMPNGYYFYNAEESLQSYTLTDETGYTFVDFNLLFIAEEEADGTRLYETTKKDEFMTHLLASYNDSPPAQKVPFFVQVQGETVVHVTEEFQYTI